MYKEDCVVKRNDIDSKYKWKLEDLYADDELWESDFRELSEGVSGIEKLKGTASASSESLLNLLESYGRFSKKFEKLFVYARMRLDEDNGNAKYQDMAARSEFLLADFSARTSFIEPELSSISEEEINKFMNDNEALRLYEFDFKERIRRKKYVLSEKEENGQKLPERVLVELLLSDTELKPADRVKKKSEKNGLYEALDLGAIWLDRALKE
jgi:oligoendopeptidase F